MFIKKNIKWLLNLPRRFKLAAGYHAYRWPQIVKWLFNERETTNFTYALYDRSLDYLASLLTFVLKADYTQIRSYIDEPLSENLFSLRKSLKITGIQVRVWVFLFQEFRNIKFQNDH